jgi:hypothetical protein
MNLVQFIKNPNTRFKTLKEMSDEYTDRWMHRFPQMSVDQALEVIAFYTGKKFYTSIVDFKSIRKGTLNYGPLKMMVHVDMLTTRMIPVYDSEGTILKPGMIVRVGYNYNYITHHVISDFRNITGTLVKILKVKNSSAYLKEKRGWYIKDIDSLYIATELVDPVSGKFLQNIQETWGNEFVNKQVCAFETAYSLRKANDKEKEIYHTMRKHLVS